MLNYELIAQDICTQGYHIIDSFLEADHYHSLCDIAQIINQKDLFRSAKIGQNEQSQQNNTIRTDKIYWIDEDSPYPSLQAYLQKLINLGNMLNQMVYLGLAEFETHFAIYQPGTFYKKHVDQFTNTKTRKISCVYYLNKTWQKKFGGELLLYNLKDELLLNIPPIGNRLVCFNSELPHEVSLTYQTRFSIAGWMKTRASLPMNNAIPQIKS
ncbi:hypothetical protein EP47_12825 [Legionella norrlandica]|uniref:Prolyl 4-hydroxylase alpha subunit domain-containing protein n=1 Tax=Legionella norrlandica TaxID=1498499 RepID=A0A0A2STF4_9GAMM|nr:2OG-Fe(II) oxygenase [Legionella norrlandica]KGP63006.1 hypothetical protein EP47_12825 [Legionella norrlandica]